MTSKVCDFTTSKHASERIYSFLSFSNTSFGLDQWLSTKSDPPLPSSGTFVNVGRHFLLSQQQDTMSSLWAEARDATKPPAVHGKACTAQQSLSQAPTSARPLWGAPVWAVGGRFALTSPFCSDSATRRTRLSHEPRAWLSFCSDYLLWS